MARLLISWFFYSRFFWAFSTLGLSRRAKALGFKVGESFALGDKTVLVTGASGGIGAAIALAANRSGAKVIACARDLNKLEAVRQRAKFPDAWQSIVGDFTLMASVRNLAAQLHAQRIGVDVLVNNVGVMQNDFQRTSEGFERSLASNVLSHFLLGESLRTQFKPDAVIINVSSGGMYGSPLSVAAMFANDASSHDGMAVYAKHKRAQVELTRHWNQTGLNSYVMHPGWVDTDGVKTALPWFRALLRRWLRNADQGADTVLWLAATQPAVHPEGGIYLDRVRDPEHVFGFTRQTEVTHADLVARLRLELRLERG